VINYCLLEIRKDKNKQLY